MNTPKRRQTHQVQIDHLIVGSDAPVVVQSMTNTDTADAYRGRAFSIYDVLFNTAECLAAGVAVLVLPSGGWSVGMTWTWPSRGRPVMLTGCGHRGRCCARDGLTLVLLVSRGWGGPGWSIGVGAACVPISPGG